jgi:hypothetical protein
MGVILRLIWTSDMEWKDDERWMFEHAQAASHSGTWAPVGMESSAGIVNPGLSVWIFTAISFFCSTPIGMARGVELLNIITLFGLVLFVLKRVDVNERKIWLWGLALAAVSPLAVLFSKKVWEQDTIVFFSMLTIIGNAYRTKRGGAFLWGLAGALIGQIHMSGFFYAAGLFVFTIIYDAITKTKTRWLWWIIGSAIGSIGLIPWITYIYNHPSPTSLHWSHLLQFSFYPYWFIDAHGLNIMYSIRKEFWELIKMPYIFNIPTYLVAVVHLFLVGVGCYSLKRIYLYVKHKIIPLKTKQSIINYIKNLTLLEFYLFSILLGLGVFMNFSGIITFQHYLIVGFPFSYLFLSKILSKKKKLLIGVITAQAIITIAFLFYVHINNGVINGDYGKTYQSQQETVK